MININAMMRFIFAHSNISILIKTNSSVKFPCDQHNKKKNGTKKRMNKCKSNTNKIDENQMKLNKFDDCKLLFGTFQFHPKRIIYENLILCKINRNEKVCGKQKLKLPVTTKKKKMQMKNDKLMRFGCRIVDT